MVGPMCRVFHRRQNVFAFEVGVVLQYFLVGGSRAKQLQDIRNPHPHAGNTRTPAAFSWLDGDTLEQFSVHTWTLICNRGADKYFAGRQVPRDRASDKAAATRCQSPERSAGFQACCIADFPPPRPAKSARRGVSGLSRQPPNRSSGSTPPKANRSLFLPVTTMPGPVRLPAKCTGLLTGFCPLGMTRSRRSPTTTERSPVLRPSSRWFLPALPWWRSQRRGRWK